MTAPMIDQQLAEIEKWLKDSEQGPFNARRLDKIWSVVPLLIAEVRRLQERERELLAEDAIESQERVAEKVKALVVECDDLPALLAAAREENKRLRAALNTISACECRTGLGPACRCVIHTARSALAGSRDAE